MILARQFLIALLLALQGIAPLLHAHVRDQAGNGEGVHMVGLGDIGELATSPWSSARGDEAPFVEPGEAHRRGHVPVPDAAGPRSLPPTGATEWHSRTWRSASPPCAQIIAARIPEARAPPFPSV